MAPRKPFREIILADNYPMWRNNCTLLVCDRIYSLLNNDAKHLGVDETVMILEKLHNVGNIIQTIMEKRPVWFNEWVFSVLFWHFDPLSPFQCCNQVEVSTERIATLKTGRLRKDADKKRLLCSNVSTLLSMIVIYFLFSLMPECLLFLEWTWLCNKFGN